MIKDLISIIVPVYNVEKYLNKCIESIVNQTYQNLEIILINDGSTDNSGKICDKWAQKDNRVKVIHKENGGVSSARNAGLKVANGEFIGFVDPDDYIELNMYEIMYNAIAKENIDFVMCDFRNVLPEEKLEKVEKSSHLTNKFEIYKAFENVYPFWGQVWRCLFHKHKLKNIYFDTKMYIAEDLKFICEYILKCENEAIFINEKLYYYVKRENSATTATHEKQRRLKYIVDLMNAVDNVENMIKEKYKDAKTLKIIQKRTIMYYWMFIYSILDEKLEDDNKIVEQYYYKLKLYKKYFSLKDNVYMFLLSIHPKLFYIVYKNIKKIKNSRKDNK